MAEASRPSPKSAASDPDPAVDRPGAPDGGRSPGNLPLELSSFVGRPREIAEVERLLRNTRLLTLTGPGGSGKTRLALAVGSGSGDDYEDGVWLMELAPLSDPELVPQAVASVLGVREEPGTALLDSLRAHLKAREILLVLDNCEHLVDACADLANALLRSCPDLKVFATSREALGIVGETLFVVPPTLPARPPAPAGHRGSLPLRGDRALRRKG